MRRGSNAAKGLALDQAHTVKPVAEFMIKSQEGIQILDKRQKKGKGTSRAKGKGIGGPRERGKFLTLRFKLPL